MQMDYEYIIKLICRDLFSNYNIGGYGGLFNIQSQDLKKKSCV